MPILPIPEVITGDKIRASLWNQMVAALQDLTSGHDHTGADYHGKRVAHASLVNAGTHVHTGSGLNNTLDWHMDANQASADHPLHGLPNGWTLMGNYGAQAHQVATYWLPQNLANHFDNGSGQNDVASGYYQCIFTAPSPITTITGVIVQSLDPPSWGPVTYYQRQEEFFVKKAYSKFGIGTWSFDKSYIANETSSGDHSGEVHWTQTLAANQVWVILQGYGGWMGDIFDARAQQAYWNPLNRPGISIHLWGTP